MKRFILSIGFLALSLLVASPGWAISWVEVGDAGNTADTTGYGAVSYAYSMSKYEVTNEEYCTMLNDVAASDPYGLYNADMASSRGGITQSGDSGSYTYLVKTDFANRPVNYVSWKDAARFSNWLHSGDTESGVYDPDNNWSADHSAGNYWIPTEDEWYKAAYYSGSTYYTYATQSNDAPAKATDTDRDGNVDTPGANVANWDKAFDWPWWETNGNVSIVGDCGRGGLGSDSHYGTFDQSGNLAEWIEDSGADRLFRDGHWFNCHDNPYYVSKARRVDYGPDNESSTIGFRIASGSVIPELSTLLLFSPSLLALFLYARHEKKRRK